MSRGRESFQSYEVKKYEYRSIRSSSCTFFTSKQLEAIKLKDKALRL